MKRIAFFLRVFENEKYMNDFLGGKIYINRLSYFRHIEGDLEDNRADPKEGLSALWQPDEVTVEFGGHRLTNFAAPIEMRTSDSDYLHVFCLFAGATKDGNLSDPTKIEVIREDFRVPEAFSNLGQYTVLIHNTEAFIDRMVEAVRRKGFRGNAGMVEYYDPEVFSGDFGNRAVFFKQNKFSHQKEYRFSINTGVAGNDPLIIDIGGIRDISSISDTWDVKINVSLSSEREKIV